MERGGDDHRQICHIPRAVLRARNAEEEEAPPPPPSSSSPVAIKREKLMGTFPCARRKKESVCLNNLFIASRRAKTGGWVARAASARPSPG